MPLAKLRMRWMPRSPTFACSSEVTTTGGGARVGSNCRPLSSMRAIRVSPLRSSSTAISSRSSLAAPYMMMLATASSRQSWTANETSDEMPCCAKPSIHPASRCSGFGLMDRNQRVHSSRLEDLGDVVVRAQDDQVAALALDDLGADQENANAVGGEEVHRGKINDDLSLFGHDLVEWQLDDDCPRGIEAPLQNDFGNAAGEIFGQDVHAAPIGRAIRARRLS